MHVFNFGVVIHRVVLEKQQTHLVSDPPGSTDVHNLHYNIITVNGMHVQANNPIYLLLGTLPRVTLCLHAVFSVWGMCRGTANIPTWDTNTSCIDGAHARHLPQPCDWRFAMVYIYIYIYTYMVNLLNN